jgi:hypothetical protein
MSGWTRDEEGASSLGVKVVVSAVFRMNAVIRIKIT